MKNASCLLHNIHFTDFLLLFFLESKKVLFSESLKPWSNEIIEKGQSLNLFCINQSFSLLLLSFSLCHHIIRSDNYAGRIWAANYWHFLGSSGWKSCIEQLLSLFLGSTLLILLCAAANTTLHMLKRGIVQDIVGVGQAQAMEHLTLCNK